MGYWKREYTERRGGRPLFRDETASIAEPDEVRSPAPPDPPAAPGRADGRDRSGRRPAYSRDS